MATRTPNGDQIAGQIEHNHKSTDTNLSDISGLLTDAHAHRPGVWQQDLAKTNEAMHAQGLLPGLDIVGVRGQDLITRDKSGNTQIVDSTNTNNRHNDGNDIYTAKTTEISGRQATINPDGSGSVTAGRGDNSPWVLSQAILKAQGIENPTPNQMANYQIELEKANNKKVGQIKPGDHIKIPPFTSPSQVSTKPNGDNSVAPGPDKTVQPNGQTEFMPERIEAQDKSDKTAVDTNYANAQKALDKWAGSDTPYLQQTIPASITKADIAKGLAPDSGATPEERQGLEFLQANYDRLKAQGNALWKNDVIFSYNLTDNKKTDEANTLADRYGM